MAVPSDASRPGDGAGEPGGGGAGHSGGYEGDDQTTPLPIWVATCDGAGSVPTGTDATDAENWAD